MKDSKSSFLLLLNIVVLILVIASLVLVYLVQSKHKALSNSVNMLKNVSIILDRNSGTSYSQGFATGSSVENIKNIDKQANDLISQRDNLGKTLADISNTLELPQKLTAEQFQSLKTSEKSTEELLSMAKQVNERNDNLVLYFTKIAREMRYPIKNEAEFNEANKNLEGYLPTLAELAKNAKSLSNEFTIAKSKLLTNKVELNKLEDSITTKTSDEAMQSVLSEYKNQIKELQEKNQALSDVIKIQEAKFATARQQIQQQTDQENGIIPPNLHLQLKGKILKYDKKWGFAIINLGKYNKVDYTIGNRTRIAIVPLPARKEMYVTRNNKFVAKVKIDKVLDKYAIVNLRTPSESPIQEGDAVIFPTQ